jgi:CDP-diacylglycerol--serine O-phosphatidyltransferase
MLQFVRHDHSFGGLADTVFQYPPRLLWVIAALFVVCVVLRLARFNVETDEDDSHEEFSGLPSPAAAGTVASFPLAMYGLRNLAADSDAMGQQVAAWLIPAIKIALPLITLAVACLMVSRVRYPHIFNQLFRGRRNRQHLIQLVFAAAVISQVHEMAVPLIFCYFAFASPLRAAWRRAHRPTTLQPAGGLKE